MANTKIIIDPSSRILYASFYIDGLYQIFGRKNVSFSNSYFKSLNRHSDPFAFEHYFAFVVVNPDDTVVKIAVDFCDSTDINATAYQWCDHYAKINYVKSISTDTDTRKMLLIPPSFGIKIWGFLETMLFGVSNLVKSGFKPIIAYKRFIHDYYLQYRRANHSEYRPNVLQPTTTARPYVFMIGTLWGENGEKTNQQRKHFIDLMLAKNVDFEGGFYAAAQDPNEGLYKPYMFHRPYSTKKYLEKTKHSAFVFNTPAVHDCFGWKLAEFLAMGKAIISTPIGKELSPPLEQGTHIHVVESTAELEMAAGLLLQNDDYRESLQRNAAAYYNAYASPKVVVESIVKAID